MRYPPEARCGLGAGSLKVVHHVGRIPLKSLRTAVILDLAFRMTFATHLRTYVATLVRFQVVSDELQHVRTARVVLKSKLIWKLSDRM